MSLIDLHVHTNFCDGQNSPEEMVNAAINAGYEKLGLVCHSYVDFDDCCASLKGQELFVEEVGRLKKIYADKIDILAGVEYDYYSSIDKSIFDYVIGSVHYIKINNEYLSVDLDEKTFEKIINEYFNGDALLLCRHYYDLVAQIKNKTNCDIVGHFDLVTKFNEGNHFFDTNNKEYVNIWKACLDKIECENTIFEINYGAILRGYRTSTYPDQNIIKYIMDNGGKLIKSSDAHDTDSILRFKSESEL